MIWTLVELDFGLSLINCRKTAPFLTMVSETSEVLNVGLLRCDSRERQKDGGPPSVLRGHTKWVADHEASTVGDGVG